MLVLSRRPDETITFPTLGIAIQILRVDGQTARIGIEAPRSVPIVRGELATMPAITPVLTPAVEQPGKLGHHVRGQLNTATIALYVAQRQLQAGNTPEAEDTIQQALNTLARLEAELNNKQAPNAPPRPASCIKALVVEDNPCESALLTSYLQLSGVDVEHVPDGRDALDYLSSHPRPDVVLLDMRLPRCDGPATLSAIRANEALADLKVFAVTGSAPTEYNLPPGRGGVDGWFRKPLNPVQIVETLKKVVAVHN